VVWKDANGNTITIDRFAADTVYRAEITLKAIGFYVFDEEIHFSYPPDTVAVQPDENIRDTANRVMSVVYKAPVDAKEITKYDLTPYIPAPVAGKYPVPYITVLDDADPSYSEYAGLVLWSPPSVVFKEGMNYTATVFLYAGPGRYFGQNKNFYYNGASYMASMGSNKDYRTVYITFSPAAKDPNAPDPGSPDPDPDSPAGSGGTAGDVGMEVLM
jgi:hypothetical protein